MEDRRREERRRREREDDDERREERRRREERSISREREREKRREERRREFDEREEERKERRRELEEEEERRRERERECERERQKKLTKLDPVSEKNISDIDKSVQKKIEEWKKEDKERERKRREELNKYLVEEATIMKDVTLKEGKLIDRRTVHRTVKFDDAYTVYLVLMIEEMMNDKLDEDLAKTLKEHLERTSDVEGYIIENKLDTKFILFYLNLLHKDEILLLILRTEHNKVNSILDEVIKQGIVTPEELVEYMVTNYEIFVEGDSEKWDKDMLELFEKIISNYFSTEMKNILEQNYNDIEGDQLDNIIAKYTREGV